MDPLDLDAQLAQLSLMNSRSLSPRSSDHSPKKIGPAVPPKPTKKNVPQVPQSSVVKQTCEPLYSKRLYTDTDITPGKAALSELEMPSSNPAPVTTQRKPTSHHVYSNMKMTLDNPAILEQQLEALEYHKKQLEKKGMLPVHDRKTSNGGNTINSHLYSNVPNPRKEKEPDVVYSNIMHRGNNGPIKGTIVGNDLVYSNVGYGDIENDLPPPPPLDVSAPLNLTDPSTLEYLNQASEDELPPPPSPVSSSYSELRRATDNFPQMPAYPMNYNTAAGSVHSVGHEISGLGGPNAQQTYMNTSYHNDYSTYAPSSQDSSTYESIYEPINPRPPSQLSSRSNYSLYTSYVNGPQSSASGTPTGPNPSGKLSSHKEAEVEALTDLLVHSMDSSGDVDTYGICVKCGERVIGENSGCTAMEQVYHITCFTCSQCQINLQGKPFYVLEGKPYCEEDYLNTLEKCSVCMKPILERILRATGKPYHPQCFCCVVCGNSLDGIPFTVDATNQNYCIEDFHKKFAPRCCVCKQPIMPEPGQEETVRVVALDRSFHFECYKCEDCGLLLSSEAEGRGCYPLDDHVLCKSCNAKRVQALTNRMTTEL